MSVVCRERPPSKSASRPNAKTRRRIGSARALESYLHRARLDAAQEAHALSPVTGRFRRHRLTAGRDVCAGLKATMEDVGTNRWKGPRRLRQMTRLPAARPSILDEVGISSMEVAGLAKV
jgi:hypothetical protein